MSSPRQLLGLVALASLGSACVDVSQLVGFGCDGGVCHGADAGSPVANPNGSACAASGDCASGFCVAGLCCTNGCSGACETCAAPGREGTCAVRAAGSACGDFACDGATGQCPGVCEGAAQCAAGRSCVGPPDGVCVDDDECAQAGRCGANATCTNTPGAFRCACDEGFMGLSVTGASTTCVDVDECSTPGACGPNAGCTNTEGSFECSCAQGFFGATVVGGPASCSAVNNCAAAGQCGANATCASTATSYTCTCNAGFSGATTTGSPAACVDADECATAGICGAGATCANTPGSFTCTCRAGFVGSTTMGTAATCTDVDECSTSGLCGANGVCTNTPAGSYTCGCAAGFFGAAVVGGPATCSTVDNCTTIATCGANATCATTPTSYTCTCDRGYAGATTTGGPATCADVDECAQAGVCGADATCSNTPGTFTCACAPGFTGPTTTGAPTSCARSLQVLGTAQGQNNTLVVTLATAVPAGAPVVAAYALGTTTTPTLADSRGNTWTRVAHNQNCGACGAAGVFFGTLTTALQVGDTLTLQGTQQRSSGLWVATAPAFPFVDKQGAATQTTTTMPSAVTTAPVSDPFELVVGVLGTSSSNECKTGVLLEPAAPAQAGLLYSAEEGSAVIGSYVGSGLTGPQAFAATSPLSCRFSGVVVTFLGGAPEAPTGLTLSHTPNGKSFTVGWAAGRGNGGATGCQVQVAVGPTAWANVGTADCDTTTAARAFSLPSSDGWSNGAWASLAVRLVRVADGAILGTFPQRLTCAPLSPSPTATPTVDEDCDGSWDDATCAAYGWVAQRTFDTTFTACTNSTGVATTFACTASTAGVTRYTNGTSTGGNQSPATSWSSDQVGTACQGSFQGAAEWRCTGSTCSYQ